MDFYYLIRDNEYWSYVRDDTESDHFRGYFVRGILQKLTDNDNRYDLHIKDARVHYCTQVKEGFSPISKYEFYEKKRKAAKLFP